MSVSIGSSESKVKSEVSCKLDRVGSVVSFICAVHCMITPLFIVVFPIAVAELLGHSMAHNTLIIASICLATISIAIGHKRHKNYNIFILPVVAALLFVFTAHQHNDWHSDWSSSLILATAGLILLATHLINRRLCERCGNCKH